MKTSRPPRAALRLRRLLAAVVVALFLAATPAVAQAAFNSTASAALSTGTYSIPAPATISGTYSCDTTRPYGSTINITAYGKVARATGYKLTVTAPDGSSSSQNIQGNTLSLTKSSTLRNGTYTYALVAMVGTWIGDPYTGTYTC
ncbi:hypothetical protein ACRB8A_14890 [Arthrobacter sp. G.S.26]|uniref:hypothetical protein n=1 Tax=Micrococcaceae TaxID=1268 RepID=UPI0025558C46|nr:hypothetical protein [Pseudarthrobacter sp. MEB009]